MPSSEEKLTPELCVDELKGLSETLGPTLWREVSDMAQVVANYLRCHPRVDEVRYPGLKSDPLFEEASHTLVGGFGPVIDYRTGDIWHRLYCHHNEPKEGIMLLESELAER